jgi:hypothetical protein
MRQQTSLRRKSRGYAMIDVSLAVLLGSGIAAAGVAAAIDQRGDDAARAQGLAMITLQGAVNQYLTAYYGQLVQTGGGTVAGVANPLAPTVTELRAVGALKDPLQVTAFNGGNYRIQISTFPAGCVAPNCNLDGLVWNDRPITDWWNNIDYPRLGVAVRTIGADGAMSTSAAPNTLQGMQGKWNTNNPAAQAGILAARTGYNSASFSQFYRRDGSLPMTNDVAAGGYNINNAKAVNAQKVNLPSGNSVQVGNALLYGDTVNAAVRSPSGNTYIQDNNGNNGGLIGANANFSNNVTTNSLNANSSTWTPNSYTNYQTVYGDQSVNGTQTTNTQVVNGWLVARNMVALPALAWAGWGCSGNGITTDPNGALLSCQGGVWRQSGGGVKNYADFDWFQGYGTFGTGLAYSNWNCALSRVGGKYAGGGESVEVVRDGGSGTWVVIGSSSSDNSGAFARITCAQF